MDQRKVLFLCTGNSCRSQMAEAIINRRDDGWKAYSAGTKPSGYVHPVALRVLEDIGIQHEGKSKHVDEIKSIQLDLIITVCDSAAEECPVWLGEGKRRHIGLPDPAQVSGTESEIIRAFRSVRDEIGSTLPGILEKYTD